MIIDWARKKIKTAQNWTLEREELIKKLEFHRDRTVMIKDMIKTATSLGDLQKRLDMSVEEMEEEARIEPGSDLAKGMISVSHWATRMIAMNFYDVLRKRNAVNYIEIQLNRVPFYENGKIEPGEPITVTVRYDKGKTPDQKRKEAEAKLEKTDKILMALLSLCNHGNKVTFEEDMGHNTLTVGIGEDHTHAGIPEDGEESFEVLKNNLYAILSGDGPHLSFAKK